jgi:glycosyltransferase involved in cell wall biosynthesis
MNILQVHNRALRPGGVDVIMETERSFLQSSGHVVEQLVLESSEVLAKSKVRAGLKGIWNVEFSRQLETTIERSIPDVVHFQTPFPVMSPAVFRTASKLGLPTVASIHSYRYSCIQGQFLRDGKICELCLGKKMKLSGLRHRCYHNSLLGSSSLTASLALHRGIGSFRHDVDVWVVNSEFVKKKLAEEGIPQSRIVIKPNAVPDPGYQRNTIGSAALFAGRLEPEKGVQTLIDAWQLMDDPPPLTILGDGSLRTVVERAADANGKIEFRGWVSRDEVDRALARARFLVLPSEWYEGQPVVAIQSFSTGTPIIASDVGNFSELISPGVNGYLFHSGSAVSLASVVTEAWSDTHCTPGLRQGARSTYLRHHTDQQVGNRLLFAYDQAIRQRQNTAAMSGHRKP